MESGRPTGPSIDPAGRAAWHRRDRDVEFSRIVAFSDGVFAIAITLLVLALGVPADATDLSDALWDQRNEFFAYAISFAVLGKFWIAHHRFFSSVARFDSVLIGLNLLYLAFVALIPFTSEVLGEYSEDSTGLIVYAASIVAVSATFQAQILHAYRRDLVEPWARQYERRFTGPANLVVIGVFIASIPVALVDPDVAPYIWLLAFLAGRRLGDRLARQRAPK